MKIINLKECQVDYTHIFEGSSDNMSVLYNNESYMIKYNKQRQKNNPQELLTVNRQSVLSEYIASKIIHDIYPNSQEVELGYDDKKKDYVILCKNFLKPGENIFEIEKISSRDCRWHRNFVNNWDKYIVPTILPKVPKQVVNDLKAHYFIQAVLDYLIANIDRHVGNWGYIINSVSGSVRVCPMFDNGSSLGVSIRINKNTPDIINIDGILNNYPIIKGVKINTESIRRRLLPKEFYSAVSFIKNKIDFNKCIAIFDEISKLEGVQSERIKLFKEVFTYRYNILFGDSSENKEPKNNNPKKIMSCFRYKLETDTITPVQKDSLNEELWKQQKDRLDDVICRKDGDTLYNIISGKKDKRYILIFAYNIGSEENAKRLIKKFIR